MDKTDWIRCPKCGSKTRTMIREHTVLEDFSLFFKTLFTGCPSRGDFIPAPGYYRTVKLLDSFIYQCSEAATRNTRLYKLLAEISKQLKIFAFNYSPQYDKAPWTAPSWEQ